jgi:tetratricopeptide (TPR) repeat protein
MVWACWRRKISFSVPGGAIIGFVVGFIVVVSPFMINTYRTTGDVAVTPAGGFNLYIANNPDNPLPYYRPVRFALSSPSEQAIGFTIEASRREGRRLTPKEASNFWVREVTEHVLTHPAAFARKTALKILAVFNRYESADNHHLGFLKDHIGFLRLPFFSLWLILPFGMAGLTMLFFRSEKTVLAGLLFVFYTLTMVIFFANVRIRLPVVVILIPFGVMGLGRLVDAAKAKERQVLFTYGALVAFFFILAFLPIPGRSDTTAYLNIHAANLASKGLEKEAFSFWEKSAAMQQPYSAYANLSMADRYLGQGDTEAALAHLTRIPDDNLAAAIKFDRIGDVMMKLGRTREAVAAYRTSLGINFGQPLVRLKLIRIYEKTDVALAKQEKETLDYVFSFYGIEP